VIYHKVAPFIAKAQTAKQKAESVTPGRIGTVFFFPQASYEILEGKKKGWGRKTNFGKNNLVVM